MEVSTVIQALDDAGKRARGEFSLVLSGDGHMGIVHWSQNGAGVWRNCCVCSLATSVEDALKALEQYVRGREAIAA